MKRRTSVALEIIGLALAGALAWWAGDRALIGALDESAQRTVPLIRATGDAWALVRAGRIQVLLGIAALAIGRLVMAWRAGRRSDDRSIFLPLVLPAMATATALGWALQVGYGDPLRSPARAAPGFALGVLLAGIGGALVLAGPFDPERIVARLRPFLPGAILGTFVLLALFGHGPRGSGTRINLGPFQPLEFVKLGFAAYLADYLGRRAAKLRWQRAGFLRFPRATLLLPAVLVLVALFAGLLVVRDLGPTLILSLLFAAMFAIVTRSPGWVGLAAAGVSGGVGLLAWRPEWAGAGTAALRLRMWLQPWLNGLPGGDQAASARWAVAAGGAWGQGLGRAARGALPAGHTDLVLAHLAEETGLAGVLAYLGLVAVVLLSGLVLAARSRTAERALLAASFSLLLLAQVVVISYGSLGLVPLTGVVVPWLSAGRTSMVCFVALGCVLVRLGENAERRVRTEELDEIAAGTASAGIFALGALALAGLVAAGQGLLFGRATSARGVVTTLSDGTVLHQQDRRVRGLAARVPRGPITDREGRLIAVSETPGDRRWPEGAAMGTLLGPPGGELLRPAWSLERRFDHRLRGLPEHEDGPAVWLGSPAADDEGDRSGRERLLFAVGSREERPADRSRARALAEGGEVRLLPLPAPDYSRFARLLRLPRARREADLADWIEDVDARTVRLSIDAALQARVAEALARVATQGEAAAAVVLDVDSGRVLARAQVPHLDLSSDLGAQLRDDPSFTAAYGPWNDLTGARGVLQAGSVAKLMTALAAAREGLVTQGRGCQTRTATRLPCLQSDRLGPMFEREGWVAPVHDAGRPSPHGNIDLIDALAVSCNVFFGQLGLDLGPDPFRELVAAGLEVGWSSTFEPGAAGSRRLASTAFGQGAAALSVSQAARMVAAVADGGRIRRCPWDLDADTACPVVELLDDARATVPILAGMAAVMTRGTARGLRPPAGVRVYGKSGTADAVVLAEEVPHGLERGQEDPPPHAWFVAVGEPQRLAGPCSARAPGRLAVAVVVPRGGSGGATAGPAAMEILEAAAGLGLLGPAAAAAALQ